MGNGRHQQAHGRPGLNKSLRRSYGPKNSDGARERPLIPVSSSRGWQFQAHKTLIPFGFFITRRVSEGRIG
jgi:hypothetical protein